jgi:hypothetical protein
LTNSKQKYNAFISFNYVPVFYRPWYLDAVCDSPWEVVMHEEDGEVLGVLVYMIKRKYGLIYILHPYLCPYMGPLFYGTLDLAVVYKSLIGQLPKHHLMVQDYFHGAPEIRNQPAITKRKYTYTIDKDVDLEVLNSQLSSDRRRKIRKASEQFTYQEEELFAVFSEFLDRTFTTRGKSNPYANGGLAKLDRQLSKKQTRKIVKCVDSEGKIMAMGYFVKDEKWVYNLATGVDSNYPHEAMSLMMWNEITSALNAGISFDFEGSSIPGVETFYKAFKGKKLYYQSIYRSQNKLVDLLVKIKNPEILS